MIINVSDREFHTILDALRLWQHKEDDRLDNSGDWTFDNLATNDGEVVQLDVEEVGDLCRRINDSGPQVYLIQNKFSPELWWSNETGWGSCAGADLFDGTEQVTLNTPVDGVWVSLEDLPIEVDRKEDEIRLWMRVI